MNAVKNWSAVISGSVLLCVILEFLIPPGKVGKSMNIILGAFVMCSAIGWFKSFDVRNFKSSLNLKKFEAPEEKTKKLNSTAEEIIARNIESIIQRILKDINVPYKKIEIFMDRNEDNCIVMIRCKIYISNSAKDDSEKIKKESNDCEKKYITVKDSEGTEHALAVTEIEPKIKGVIIACAGGDNPVVKKRIIEAATTALSIPSRRVCVTKSS